MKKTLHLYWFSGSGNTLRAAEVFAERLRELGWAVELRPIEQEHGKAFDPEAVLGLAFPTHCFSIPKIVRTFVRRLPTVSRTPALMLGTHGAFSGGVLGPMRRLLTAKGFHCVVGTIISMPDSFFPFFSDATNRRHLQRALDQVRQYADDFDALSTSKHSYWPRLPIFSDIHGFLFGTLFASRKLLPVFHATVHAQDGRCTRCDTCVRCCPVGALNRTTPESVPQPNRLCTNCLRCVAVCPADAMRHLVGFAPYRSEPSLPLRQRLENELADEPLPIGESQPVVAEC